MHQSALVDIGTGNDQHGQDVTIAARREGKLPSASRGYYHEYTVATPGSSDRRARRIVTGERGELYYTPDHYRSFKRVRE